MKRPKNHGRYGSIPATYRGQHFPTRLALARYLAERHDISIASIQNFLTSETDEEKIDLWLAKDRRVTRKELTTSDVDNQAEANQSLSDEELVKRVNLHRQLGSQAAGEVLGLSKNAINRSVREAKQRGLWKEPQQRPYQPPVYEGQPSPEIRHQIDPDNPGRTLALSYMEKHGMVLLHSPSRKTQLERNDDLVRCGLALMHLAEQLYHDDAAEADSKYQLRFENMCDKYLESAYTALSKLRDERSAASKKRA
jgi:hypothetical protein